MVGVTSPLFRGGDTRSGNVLIGGYVAGTAVAGTMVFFALTVASLAVSAVLPAKILYLTVAACAALLLVLDLFGKTPHANRQTPQLIASLPPFARGFVWGLDIGLLFTTIKVTSLVWALMLLSIAAPNKAAVAVALFYAAFLLTEGVALLLDLRLGPARIFAGLQRRGFRVAARVVSAMLLAAVVADLLGQVF